VGDAVKARFFEKEFLHEKIIEQKLFFKNTKCLTLTKPSESYAASPPTFAFFFLSSKNDSASFSF